MRLSEFGPWVRRVTGRAGGVRAQLITAGAGTLVVKVLSAGLASVAAVLLARALGPDGYGVYSYAFAVLSLVAIPAQGGLPALIVRETARADVHEQWGVLRGLWSWSNKIVAWISVVVILGVGVGVWWHGRTALPVERTAFLWGAVLVPLIALGNLRGAALRGLREVVVGQLPEYVLRPGFLILFVGVAMIAFPGRLRADTAMLLHVLAAGVSFGIGVWLLRRDPRAVLSRGVPAVTHAAAWLRSTLPLAVISGTQVVITQLDTVVLGLFAPASDIGLYRVAVQASLGVSFALVAIGLVTMPYFARFHASGDLARLQKTATGSAVASTVLALPVAAPLIFLGGPLLHLIFGAQYSGAVTAMAILAGGQFVNAAFGMIGPLLIMAGHERAVAGIMAATAAGNLLLCLGLIPRFGVVGAAVAATVTLLAWNLALWVAVRRRVGVDTSVLSILRVGSRTAAP